MPADNAASVVDSSVLDTVKHGKKPMSPVAVIESVSKSTGSSDADVRASIWRLIARQKIALTVDRLLSGALSQARAASNGTRATSPNGHVAHKPTAKAVRRPARAAAAKSRAAKRARSPRR